MVIARRATTDGVAWWQSSRCLLRSASHAGHERAGGEEEERKGRDIPARIAT